MAQDDTKEEQDYKLQLAHKVRGPLELPLLNQLPRCSL